MDATPSEVREALEQEQLIPFFQPIVDLRTGRLSGFEVLARWLHPVRGAILPDNFVSLAESQRLIPRLTRQIVHRSFVSASTIPANLFITINVSPSEMSSEALAPMLREEADRTGFKLNRLMIEVTEAVLVDDLSSARRGDQTARNGVQISSG